MIRINFTFLSIVFILFSSCTPEAEKINYGEDGCHFCQMSIVDPRYGAELVTTKGKVFKFDAVECLINYINKNNIQDIDIAFTLVNSYSEPESLNDAKSCTYLISKKMPSPMGMYITPFINSDSAISYQKKNSGTLLTWLELNNEFPDLPDLIQH